VISQIAGCSAESKQKSRQAGTLSALSRDLKSDCEPPMIGPVLSDKATPGESLQISQFSALLK